MPNWGEVLFHFSLYLAEGWCIQYLFRAFAISRWEELCWSRYAVGVFWVLYQTLCRFIGPDYFSSSFANLFLYPAILLLFSSLWYRGGLLLKFFLVLQFVAIHELCTWAGNSLLWFNRPIGKLLVSAVERQTIAPDTFLRLLRIATLFFILMAGIVREVLTYFFIRRIVNNFRHKQQLEKDAVFYMLPAVAGVLTAALIRLLILTVENGYAVTLYEKYPSLYLILPLIALTLLAADVFSFQTYQNMITSQQERAEKVILENQIMQMQESIVKMEHMADHVSAVKHDMKNHMMVLQRLLLGGDSSSTELQQYLDSLCTAVEQLDVRIHTGNIVSDAVINNKFQYAEKEIDGIRLDASSFFMTDTVAIKAYDMGIILSNGLDNAIDACKKLRLSDAGADVYIAVRSFSKGRMFFIEIENSFDGVVQFDRTADLPCSTKGDQEVHGIGLRNIRNCVKKYLGDIDCIVEGRKFTLSIMIENAKSLNG